MSLPCTVSAAVVFSPPHTQVYSPASLTSTAWISSCAVVPSCLRVYFSLDLSTLCFFFHSTGAALESSHCSVAVAPSAASSFFSSFLKCAGKAGGGCQNEQKVCPWQLSKKHFVRALTTTTLPNQAGSITTLGNTRGDLGKLENTLFISQSFSFGMVYGTKWRTTPVSPPEPARPDLRYCLEPNWGVQVLLQCEILLGKFISETAPEAPASVSHEFSPQVMV